jgi:alanine dehydrogenase
MDIGIPKETKDQEFRVGLTPSTVRTLIDRGHQVYIETNAGIGSSFTDSQYIQAGAKIVPTAAAAWDRAMVVKVKEPLSTEYSYLQKNQILFTYLHLAANRTLTEQLIDTGVSAIAYETVELPDGKLPLLSPMSIVAGRLSVQFGARFLEKQQGGSGVLLGGVPGVQPGQVAILGGGIVGTEAARMAVGIGAQVTILDVNIDRLSYLETIFGARVNYLYSNAHNIETTVRSADLVIGAVLIPGKRAPILVSAALVGQMKPGSVIIDVAVDQGGCIETLHPTSHTNPVYVEAGVVHYGVPNMPGAVPWTATQALNNSTAPYIIKLADRGLDALTLDLNLAKGMNIRSGKIIHPAVREVFPDLAS